ncbi:MAG: aldehyde dehydrogenase family protein [Verrucomicrobiota bacterium]
MKLSITHLSGIEEPPQAIAMHRGNLLSAIPRTLRRAQQRWAQNSLLNRLKILKRFRHLLAEQSGQLAALVSEVTYRPESEILSAQIIPLADACKFMERRAVKILSPRRLGSAQRPAWLTRTSTEVHLVPLGVVLVITPSNFPLFIPGIIALQALVAGNAVLLKPAPGVGIIAKAFLDILISAGLDKDLLHILPESTGSAQSAIASGVDKIVFTGSAEIGEKILHAAADQLTPVILELSGCDAVFVRADADLDLVVRSLRFGLRLNSGATCIAPRRVFVHHSRATELEGRLAEAVRNEESFLLNSKTSFKIFPLVENALRQGAHLVQGELLSANSLRVPLILAGAKPTMELLRNDIFAPVISLVTVSDDLESLQFAAQCPFALGASIFSSDKSAAAALAQKIQAGVITINDLIVPTADPRVPFGGRKRSGFGVTRGAEGLLEMTAPKVIAISHGKWRPHLQQPQPGEANLLKAFLKISHGGSLRQKFAGLISLMRLARKKNLSVKF